jgi:hypothetical protein
MNLYPFTIALGLLFLAVAALVTHPVARTSAYALSAASFAVAVLDSAGLVK